ncbi:MAG: hypothetical protein ABI835_11235, partial [Chloroflexota bacterium]
DLLGMMIHTTATANGFLDMPLRAAVFAFWEDGSPLPANNRASYDARTDEGQLTMQQVVTPAYDSTAWDDLWFFIPYDYLPDGDTGTHHAYIEAKIGIDGQPFTAFSETIAFTYTYPDQQLIVDVTNVEHNVEINNQVGMQVHTNLHLLGYAGETMRVALFVYWADGTGIPGSNAPSENNSPTGTLTVQTTITPSITPSDWQDFWFFLPYDYFPTGLHGEQQAYAQVEIGVDGEGFTSWSRTANFSLTYP